MTATLPDDVPATTRAKADLTMTSPSLDTTGADQTASAHHRHRATAEPAYRITLGRVIRAEWIKLRSLRSTWVMLAAVLLTIVGLGAIAAASTTGAVEGPDGGGGPGDGPGGGDALSTVLAVLAAWIMVGLAGAAVALTRRDA